MKQHEFRGLGLRAMFNSGKSLIAAASLSFRVISPKRALPAKTCSQACRPG